MAKIKMRPDELTTPMKPPEEMIEAILELGKDAADAWYGDEDVSDDIVHAYATYEAWCRGEQEKRLGVLLKHMGYPELTNDRSENAPKWKRLAMTLAQMAALPGLMAPTPQFKKTAGRKNVDKQILDAVGKEIDQAEKAGRHISSQNRAFELAKKNNPWMEKITIRQFQDAKQRFYQKNPDLRPRPGKAPT
jgi:hypothetical protein